MSKLLLRVAGSAIPESVVRTLSLHCTVAKTGADEAGAWFIVYEVPEDVLHYLLGLVEGGLIQSFQIENTVVARGSIK